MTIFVQPRYPADPTPEVIEDFCQNLRNALPVEEITVNTEQPTGHQVSPWEIITVWIPAAESALALVGGISALVAHIAVWLKKRHESDGGMRPRLVELYGPDGRVVKRIAMPKGAFEVELDEPNPDEALRLPPHR